jgi:hypothetical protein
MYDLHILGWNSFQQLCLTIIREILGQTVELFLDTNDGGQDGAFAGRWKPNNDEILTGSFVIQCKFTGRANYVLRLADLTDEVAKVKKLVEMGRCDNYLLMTNAGVSGRQVVKIERAFMAAGAKQVRIFGSSWISQQIRENKRLRMLVPRVYGLGDLSQILDERAYAQAQAILDTLREDLAKVVVTESYGQAVAALDRHGFVLLIGEPASGKTTIASMLAMAAADQWNASVLKLDSPGKAVERWNPEEPSQFFWVDDAFGVSQYEDFLVREWNHVPSQIAAMLRKGAKVVLTSRDYIYNHARRELKISAFPLLEESQVVIDVQKLSDDERRQILYNHLKLGRQPAAFRTQIKPHLESVATHKRFIPEVARRLSDPLFTKGLDIDAFDLDQFVEKREQILQDILQGLDSHSKAALALIYMREGRLDSPINLRAKEKSAIGRLGSDIGHCTKALRALNSSLVIHTNSGGESFWRFKHPTIGDAHSSLLVQDPELLGIYLRGIAPDKLINQVTCGDIGLEKAVIIPKSLFSDVLVRLREIKPNNRYKSEWLKAHRAESDLNWFLIHRCSKEFLALYIRQNPSLLDKVSEPTLYLNTDSRTDLALRLNDLDLLPEETRLSFVEAISEYAIQGLDLTALHDGDIRSVFRGREFDQLIQNVRNQLLPKLDDVRQEEEGIFDPSLTPEEHMQHLLESLDILMANFGRDTHTARVIQTQMDLVNYWIAENTVNEPEIEPRTLGSIAIPESATKTRSIFDDVDS